MVVTLGGNPYAGIGRAGGGRRRDEQSRHYRGNLHCNLDGNFEHDSGQRHNDSHRAVTTARSKVRNLVFR